MRASIDSRYLLMARRSVRRAIASGVLTLLLATAARVAAQGTAPPAPPAAQGDFGGLVDIGGGRRMYLECRGSGSPPVILVSGWPNTGGVWRVLYPEDAGPAVLPGVAAFTRVCTYDRPGTVLDIDPPADYPRSRSDPVPQPTTVENVFADLHALLQAAGVPGPYVLVGHSLGGLFARFYAATYPDEVVGLVLVDALSEGMRAALTPDQWVNWLATNGVATPKELASYREFERLDLDASISAMGRAAAAQPLRRLPLVVLSAGRTDGPRPQYHRDALAANQAFQAALVPDARHVPVPESGHTIQVERPALVIDAIRQVVAAVRDPSTWPLAAARGDFAGLVDIGGRRLYLECRGTGSPTVVLEAGGLARGDIWSRDLHEPAGSRLMVLPAVAGLTRVCAYDRPGTIGEVDPNLHPSGPPFFPSRSDPVPMPRTARDIVPDLHALLQAAGVPGPYVLVGHSVGGMFVRVYASTYPDEVVGLVLVDGTPESVWVRFEAVMTPTQWATFERLQFSLDPPDEYPERELLDLNAIAAQMRQVRASTPLRPMPLAVLAHGRPFDAPFPDWSGDAMEQIMLETERDLATLVPDARFSIASQAGHNIHQDQPALVIEAIRQVVTGVRDRDTWYDLASCCAK